MPLLNLLARVLPFYQPSLLQFGIIGGAVPFGREATGMNDLLSLPDLVAGTIADYLTKRATLRPEHIFVKEGAADVLLWLTRNGLGLKKLCVLLRPGANSMIERGIIELSPVQPVETVFVQSSTKLPFV